MTIPHSSSQTSFGFISVREIEGLGHCGGLLIVSQIGRPIEFHCSAPVVTNRAQKILYGKTYESFLYCEQIGLSLIDKAKIQPQLLIANCGQLLALNDLVQTPVVVLAGESNRDYFADQFSHHPKSSATSFELQGQIIWCGTHEPKEIRRLQGIAELFTKSLPLDEPFERIQKAIEEAQAVAR